MYRSPTGLLDLTQVNFSCIRQLTNTNLSFKIFNPLGDRWEEFQIKWKESRELFYTHNLGVSNSNSLKEADLENGNPKVVTTHSASRED